jgi:hypothetical protein
VTLAKQTPKTCQNLTLNFQISQMHDPKQLAKAAPSVGWSALSLLTTPTKSNRKNASVGIAALKRRFKHEKNYEAIALLPRLKAAMLSHLKNCDDCHT